MDARAYFLTLYDHAHGAVPGPARRLLEEPTPAQLRAVPPGHNSLAWLIWHIARGQDIQIAMLIDSEQEWVTANWAPRFGLEPDPWNMGYGHTPEQVANVQPESVQVLVDYYDAVWARTEIVLEDATTADLDRVVEENWDPPVTMGVRLVSIVDDDVQHAGQAWYLRGLFERSQ